MRPRRQRWISIPEVLDNLAERSPVLAAKLEGKTRKRKLEAVRRLVRRAERRDACRFTKRVDGDIFVNVDTLEALLPADVEKVAEVERDLAELNQAHRGLVRRVNAQGSKIREVDTRLANVEEIQRHLAEATAANTRAMALLSRA